MVIPPCLGNSGNWSIDPQVVGDYNERILLGSFPASVVTSKTALGKSEELNPTLSFQYFLPLSCKTDKTGCRTPV